MHVYSTDDINCPCWSYLPISVFPTWLSVGRKFVDELGAKSTVCNHWVWNWGFFVLGAWWIGGCLADDH